MADAVEGPNGNGQAASRPPVQIAGVDSNGIVRRLQLNSSGQLVLSASVLDIGEVQLLGADGLHAATIDAAGNLHVDGSGVTQPVSGTFWQATQPVSVASMPSTPVTGPVTDTQLRATPVPVSGTVSANATLTAETTKVIGTVNVSSGQTVGLAAGTQVIGHVVVDTAPTTAVTGTFFQATQPVSASTLPLPTGAATETTLAGVKTGTDRIPANLTVTSTRLLVDGSGVTQPVSGTFWQATQPVSGTFWQATQPVSIASMPSTPVTGTFFQATQPVSLASAPTTPVTGTFWQATQPVSGAVSVSNLPATQVVDGSAVTQPVADSVGNAHLQAIRDSLNEIAFASILTAEWSFLQ